MEMFNEVWVDCPDCGKNEGYMKIPQVTFGFGNFNLSDRTTLEDLERHEFDDLMNYIKEDKFVCDNCENVFNPLLD
jgi:glutamate formiminotransferase